MENGKNLFFSFLLMSFILMSPVMVMGDDDDATMAKMVSDVQTIRKLCELENAGLRERFDQLFGGLEPGTKVHTEISKFGNLLKVARSLIDSGKILDDPAVHLKAKYLVLPDIADNLGKASALHGIVDGFINGIIRRLQERKNEIKTV